MVASRIILPNPPHDPYKELSYHNALMELVRWHGEMLGKSTDVADQATWWGALCGIGEAHDDTSTMQSCWLEMAEGVMEFRTDMEATQRAHILIKAKMIELQTQFELERLIT